MILNLINAGCWISKSATYCVAMTATPGETTDQVVQILNVVNTGSHFHTIQIGQHAFVDKARGLISYVQLSGDYWVFCN